MATNLQQQPRAAIYARVSTSNNGQDPTLQTRELRESVSAEDGTLQANTSTSGCLVQKKNARNSISCSLTHTVGGLT